MSDTSTASVTIEVLDTSVKPPAAIPGANVHAPWQVLANGDIKLHEGTADGQTDANGNFVVQVDFTPVIIAGTEVDPLFINLLGTGTVTAVPRPSKSIPDTTLNPGDTLVIRF